MSIMLSFFSTYLVTCIFDSVLLQLVKSVVDLLLYYFVCVTFYNTFICFLFLIIFIFPSIYFGHLFLLFYLNV